MFMNFNYGFRAPPHAHELDDGRIVRLTDMEQRELDRLHRKIGQISDKAVAAGMEAGGEATAPTGFVVHMMEALILEIATWMLSVDLETIAQDDMTSQAAPRNEELLALLGQLTPSEANLLRDGICHNRDLWKGLCKLSPSPDLNPLPPIRPPKYEAMRGRYLSWVNTLLRALPAPSAHAPDAPAEGTARKPTPQQAALVTSVAEQMSRMNDLSGLAADIAPHLVVMLPGWPAGRPLQILSLDGQTLHEAGPDLAPGQQPVTVLSDQQGQFWGQSGTRKVPTPPAADRFYRAILASMTTPERSALLESVGGNPDDAFASDSITRLREAARQQLAANPQQFGPLLEVMHLKKTMAQR